MDPSIGHDVLSNSAPLDMFPTSLSIQLSLLGNAADKTLFFLHNDFYTYGHNRSVLSPNHLAAIHVPLIALCLISLLPADTKCRMQMQSKQPRSHSQTLG